MRKGWRKDRWGCDPQRDWFASEWGRGSMTSSTYP